MSPRFISIPLVLASALLASSAIAQDSHRFDAKKLEAAYKLPIYAPRGAVVGDEVIEDVNDVQHSHNAIYEVRGDVKKAVEFLTKAIGPPKTKQSDTGTTFYTFTKKDEADPLVLRKVTVHLDPDSRQVQVALHTKVCTSKDDLDED